jgi:hypothetical protein
VTDYVCAKCNGTDYERREIRTEGGLLSAAFDVSTNRFMAVSCTRCGYTELYRTNLGEDAQVFDFLV